MALYEDRLLPFVEKGYAEEDGTRVWGRINQRIDVYTHFEGAFDARDGIVSPIWFGLNKFLIRYGEATPKDYARAPRRRSG